MLQIFLAMGCFPIPDHPGTLCFSGFTYSLRLQCESLGILEAGGPHVLPVLTALPSCTSQLSLQGGFPLSVHDAVSSSRVYCFSLHSQADNGCAHLAQTALSLARDPGKQCRPVSVDQLGGSPSSTVATQRAGGGKDGC